MATKNEFAQRLQKQITASPHASLDLSKLPLPTKRTALGVFRAIVERRPQLTALHLRLSEGRWNNAELEAVLKRAQELTLKHGGSLLGQLQSLDLSNTLVDDEGVSVLATLAGKQQLPPLRMLNVSGTQVTDVGLLALVRAAKGQLCHLQKLNVSNTQVTDTSVSALALAAERGHIADLHSLDLARTQITDESVFVIAQSAERGHLTNLHSLYLEGTHITDKGVLALARVLKKVRRIPPLVPVVSGMRLALSRWAEAAEPGEFSDLAILKLSGTKVTAPDAILNGNAPGILQWYCDLDAAQNAPQLLPEAKLLIVGEGSVGKSVLCQRVFLARTNEDRYVLPPRDETHGFDMHEVTLPPNIPMPNGFNTLKLRLWDFGGQHQLHGSHRFFVGADRAFYLLVLDASKNSGENRLTYWLRFIAQHGTRRTGDEACAPVVIVLTQWDRVLLAEKNRLPDALQILKNYQELQAALATAKDRHYFGANVVEIVDGVGVPDSGTLDVLPRTLQTELRRRHDAACEQIQSAVARHLDQVIQLRDSVPPSELAIRNWVLEQFQPTGTSRPLTQFRYDGPAFKTWSQEQQIGRDGERDVFDDRVTNALRVLKSLGLVHWMGDVLDARNDRDNPLRTLVFNPRWVKTPVYRVIRAEQVEDHYGWITNEHLEKLLPICEPSIEEVTATANDREWFDRQGFTKDDRFNVQQLMQASGLLFQVIRGPQKEGWLIPDKLFEFKHSGLPPVANDAVKVRYDLPFLPDRVLLQFLARQLVKRFGEWSEIDKDKLQQLRDGVYRNFARLPWNLTGHNDEFTVEIHTEICPPADAEPWLSVTVIGGSKAVRERVFQQVICQLDAILEDEGLETLPEPVILGTPSSLTFSPWNDLAEKILARLKSDRQKAFWKELWRLWSNAHPDGPQSETSNSAWVPFNDLSAAIWRTESRDDSTLNHVKGEVEELLQAILHSLKYDANDIEIEAGQKGSHSKKHYRLIVKHSAFSRKGTPS